MQAGFSSFRKRGYSSACKKGDALRVEAPGENGSETEYFIRMWQKYKIVLEKAEKMCYNYMIGNMGRYHLVLWRDKGRFFMLNNRKVRLMTRLAMYEQNEGKEDIRLSKYFRTDYVRLQVLKTIVALTAGYLLVLMILALYHSEYLIRDALILDYRAMIARYAGIYVVLVAVYCSMAMVGYMIQYRASRKKLAKYFRMLRRLRSMYREEDGEEAAGEEENIGYDSNNT